MMRSSRRGAARISAVWMIAAGVLALAALALAFIAQSDLSNAEDTVARAKQSEEAATAQAAQRAEERRNLSLLLGWYNRDSADPASDVEAVKAAMTELRGAFPDISATDADFESMLPKIRATLDSERAKVAELRSGIKRLEDEVAAANEAVGTVRDDKDQVIGELRAQYADLEKRLADREAELERRVAQAQDQLSERDASLRETVAEAEGQARRFNRTLLEKDTRINVLSDQTQMLRAPFSDLPDGSVVEVSRSTPYGYIDLGADHRVSRGMRFRVESSGAGGAHTKAWAEVSEVFPDYSEVRIFDLADRYDPVTAGDRIINPLYDPDAERFAVLLGRFDGTYNKAQVVSLLERMGIHVQDELDYRTNYVILGAELYDDPETNEPLETPLSPTQLPAYKRAQNLGAVFIPIEQLRDYFRVYAG